MIKKLTFVIILSLEIVYCSTQNSFKLKIGNQEYIITANNINDTFEVTINNNTYDMTPLIYASYSGNLSLAKFSIENGANVNAIDFSGDTALRVVLEKENWEIAKYLIEHGADINTEVHGKTALIIASETGNFDMVKYLVEKGADINAFDDWDGISALMKASRFGYFEIVKYLVENGANINAKDNNHWSALMYASTMGYSQIVKYLIEKGADKEEESGNSQEPKLVEKYLFATLKGKIDGKYDITINIQIFDVYSLVGGMAMELTVELTGNYHYDKFGKNIYFTKGTINKNSMTIEAGGDEVFTFELDEETLKKILEFKNITINGTWENKSKKFPCVINSVSPLGGKLSEMFEYKISNNEYDYGKNILYSPSMNVSYFVSDMEKIDIKNLKNTYEQKLKKVVSNETYTYSNCSSEITYFDDKILCIEDILNSSTSINFEDYISSLENKESEDSFDTSDTSDTYYYDYNIISLETGKKLNNTLEDLVDYDEIFIIFLTEEYKYYFKTKIESIIEEQNSIKDLFKNLYNDLDIPENEQPNDNDFNFPEPTSYFPKDFDLPEEVSKSKFIFYGETVTIYNDWLPTIIKGMDYYNEYLTIDMKKLKPYVKKDSFYRYLFD